MPGFVARTTRSTAADDRAAPHSNLAIWAAELLARSPSVGCISSAVASTAPLAGHDLERAQHKRGHKRWDPAVVGIARITGFEVLPADDRDVVARANPGVSKQVWQWRRGVAWLPHQAERLVEHHVHRQARDLGVDQSLVADHEHAPAVGAEQEERLFKPWVEAREEGQVGEVFAVGIDRHPAGTAPLVQGRAAILVLGPWNRWQFLGHVDGGTWNVPQFDLHVIPAPLLVRPR